MDENRRELVVALTAALAELEAAQGKQSSALAGVLGVYGWSSAQVVQLLASRGRVSRAELARRLGMSTAGIGALLQELGDRVMRYRNGVELSAPERAKLDKLHRHRDARLQSLLGSLDPERAAEVVQFVRDVASVQARHADRLEAHRERPLRKAS